MLQSGRRHPHTPGNETASIVFGQATCNRNVTYSSQSSTPIEFVLPHNESRVRLDVGDEINLVLAFLTAR